MVSLFNEKARYEDVILEREAVKHHYEKHTKGYRYTLARQCFEFIESKILEGSPQAKELKAEVYKR